jgi:hypothetical protein
MKQIRLQFSRSTAWQSTLIADLCHGPFSHVDVDFGERGLLGASDSPDAPIIVGNARGVAFRPHDYQLFAVKHTAILQATDHVVEEFERLLISQLGKPFDATAIKPATFISNKVHARRDWADNGAWFCSELLAWALEGADFFPWEILVAKDRISPGDLLLLVNWAVTNIDTFYDNGAT